MSRSFKSNAAHTHPIPYHAALDTPLLDFGKGDVWTIRDAAEGVGIWGAPGSGKSSGSGQTLAQAYLRAGFGGLVLAAKPDEADIWGRYARACGRESDLLFIDDSPSSQRFNLLDYASATLGAPGFEQNLVDVMARLAEAARVADDTGGGQDGNRFFIDSAMKWIAHAFPLLRAAYGNLRLSDLSRFVASVPKAPREQESPAWQRDSFCSHTMVRAARQASGGNLLALRAVNEHGDFWLSEVPGLGDKTRGSIEATITNLIYPFLTGKLAELFCTTTTVVPEMCREGKIIVMDLPVLKYGAMGAVAQTLFKYLFGVSVQRCPVIEPGTPGQYPTRPVFLWADEAQFFLNSADADLLSTARSSKTCIVYITQDLPTYYAKLGVGKRDMAESILSKFGTRIFHANTSRETNHAAADIIGKVQKIQINQTRGGGITMGRGSNHGDHTGGYNSSGGANQNFSESTSSYMDYDIPPDFFATQLRTGSAKHGFKVDGILIRTAGNWKRTGRHWMQAEFSQR